MNMPGPDATESYHRARNSPDETSSVPIDEYASSKIAVTDPQGNIQGYKQYREGPITRDAVTGKFQRDPGTFEITPIDPRTGQPNRDLKPSRIARFTDYVKSKREGRLEKLREKLKKQQELLAQENALALAKQQMAQYKAATAAARKQQVENSPIVRGAKYFGKGVVSLAKRGLFDEQQQQQPSDQMIVGAAPRRRIVDVSRATGSSAEAFAPEGADEPVEEEVEDLLGLGALDDIIGGSSGGASPPARRRRPSGGSDFGGLF